MTLPRYPRPWAYRCSSCRLLFLYTADLSEKAEAVFRVEETGPGLFALFIVAVHSPVFIPDMPRSPCLPPWHPLWSAALPCT